MGLLSKFDDWVRYISGRLTLVLLKIGLQHLPCIRA